MVRRPTGPGDEARVLRLLERALELAPDERDTYLAENCGTGTALRQRIDRLIELETKGELVPPDGVMPLADTPPSDARPAPRAGDRFGAWQLVEPLGSGGMGEVWSARRADGSFERDVAIKVVRAMAGRDDLRQRFERERHLLARLEHPGIASVVDAGSADGQPWLAMELVRGERIDRFCETHATDRRGRLELVAQVCDAVEAAHRERIVHRDLKPANVLVRADGRAVLLDFGIAKLLDDTDVLGQDVTRTGQAALTPRYASPQQLAGQAPAPTWDVYALGVLLYELLTGRHPYEETFAGALAPSAVLLDREPRRPSEAADDPSLRGDLDVIVLRALASDPARRYPSAAALGEDIRRHLEGRPVLARPDSFWYRTGKTARRRRGALTLAGVGAAALALGLWGLAQRQTAGDARSVLAEAEVLQRSLVTHLEESLGLEHLDLVSAQLDRAGREQAFAELERGFESLSERYAEAPDIEGTLRSKASERLFRIGGLDAALRNAELAIERLEPIRPDHDPDLVRARRIELGVARLRGETERALAGLRELCARVRASAPGDRETLFELERSLLGSLQYSDRIQEALELVDRLVPVAERTYGSDSAQAANLRTSRAVVFANLGHYTDSAREAEVALGILDSAVDPDHLLLAEPLRVLAKTHIHSGNPSEALPLLERVLAIHGRWLRQDELLSLMAQAEYAHVLGSLGQLAEALGHMDRIVPALEQEAGPGSRVLFDKRIQRAGMLAGVGRIEEAFEESRACLEEMTAGVELRGTSTWFSAQHAHAAFARMLGDLELAEHTLRDLIAAREGAGFADHPQLFENRHALGQVLVAQGRNAEAVELYTDLVPRTRAALSESMPLAVYLGSLAYLHYLERDLAASEPVAREAVHVFEALPGHEMMQAYTLALDLLGHTALEREEHALAREHYERANSIRDETGRAHSWQAVTSALSLAEACSGLGDDAGVERAMRDAVARAERTPGFPPDEVLQMRISWTKRLVAEPRPEDAEERLAEAVPLLERERDALRASVDADDPVLTALESVLELVAEATESD